MHVYPMPVRVIRSEHPLVFPVGQDNAEIDFRQVNANEYRFQFSDVISDFLPSFCRYSLILMSRFMRFLNKSLITPSPLTRLRQFFP